MRRNFKVQVSRDRLNAELLKIGSFDEDFSITAAELRQFLKEQKIVHGVIEEQLEKIAENVTEIDYPVLIAKGTPAKNGVDAYLVNEVKKEDEEKETKRERLSFRDIIDIPAVKTGQLLASIIPETPGTDGKDVYGNPIKCRDGRPLRVRAGKNVVLNLEQFYSTADGQISITSREINVNPVYEISGDLDMKTGNIDFVGNVVIRGNVPTGYTIKAGGDIFIYGLVEGATLDAGGNIVISGGVSGEGRAKLISKTNIQAAYLNQASVEAEMDVTVATSIMHSQVTAGGVVNCERGSIIGGEIRAGNSIIVRDVGNQLFTRTVLQLGRDSLLDDREEQLRAEITELTETIKKLSDIEKKLSQIKQLNRLTPQQLELLSKQKATMDKLTKQLFDKDEELKDIEEAKRDIGNLRVCVSNIVFPNSHIRFGKYAKVIQKQHQNAEFSFYEGEIHFKPYL